MVRKADGTNRMTIDYTALNNITIFQGEPPGLVEKDLHQFATAMHFTILDLSRAHYQIKLNVESRKYTAFTTTLHLLIYY